MNTKPSALLIDIGNHLGFTIAILFAFVLGATWGARFMAPQPVTAQVPDAARSPTEQKPSLSPISPAIQARFSDISAEPEDFYPAAEFRQQAGLLVGGYDQLNSDPQLYVDIAKAIDRRLPVFCLVLSEEQAERGRELIRQRQLPADSMHFVPIPANTIWIRDYAPFMVRRSDNSVGLVDAKYISRNVREIRKRDEEMATTLSLVLGLPLRSIPLVLEGGNFLSNGDGSIVASSKILRDNREFDFTEGQIGEILNDNLGVRGSFCVAPLQDEATGHVDMFVSILAKNIMVVGKIDPAVDMENSKRLDVSAAYLEQITTSLGPMKVFRIPMPPKWGSLWRSYTNVIYANGLILMPSYSDVDPALEDEVEQLYRSLLPGWDVKRIPCDALVKEKGQLHCISYNLPRYVNLAPLYQLAGVEPPES